MASDRDHLLDIDLKGPSIVNFLARCNVTPWAVVGHSSGEIAAGYAPGVLSATEAILNAYYRGLVSQELQAFSKGAMAAIGLGREAVAPLVHQDAVVGCENSPDSVTVSGSQDAVSNSLEAITLASSASVWLSMLHTTLARCRVGELPVD
ncbi:hypothetical protein CDD81_4457 [Ophiocordyceps australis]|uniref:Malonyl-CoA:ACP transacylase (MAT) domain-containing protein n=1 Tax=Ophiocordyceps australis TaxID=1399860 RepID=A0A2C5YID6_9HYPO|nr:hypothetical protein CDD81_4457 [Ophiocordyceps australis]